ncbi:MAG TPA: hypothetical protein VEA44_18215 [Caulobacter sp.]|nr:hypothetical protein [Caulobacter sp.]
MSRPQPEPEIVSRLSAIRGRLAAGLRHGGGIARAFDRRPTIVRYGEVPDGAMLWGEAARPLRPGVVYD